ncbi:MAG: peptidylprolyl isomerase [Bacteroidales bacterium]|nr:peptidylprolyl isomerase [Bacteroidales bacterium]
MKRLTFIAALVIMISACGPRGGRNAEADAQADSTATETAMEQKMIEEPEFEIVTNMGTMKVKLYSKTPKHRNNFVKLVKENYYDSIRFHRVIEGFMIQTGDPYSRDTAKIDLWGQGGPDYTIPAEFVNEYWHKKGAIAAARKGDLANPMKSSSGSQFYIVHDENACLHLDGQYTIFGEVTEGLDVIDRIARVKTDLYDRPYEDVIITTIKPVYVEPAPVAENDSTATAVSDSTKTE